MNYEYPHPPTFSRNEPIGCPGDFVQPIRPDEFMKKIQATFHNPYGPSKCIINKRLKLNPLPVAHNKLKKETPKWEFMCWCWKNGRKIAEMVTEIDFEMFDKLWPDIEKIFNLTSEGNCAACKKDCYTCTYKDTPSKDSSPCIENRHFIGMDNGVCEKQGEYYGVSWAEIADNRIEKYEPDDTFIRS